MIKKYNKLVDEYDKSDIRYKKSHYIYVIYYNSNNGIIGAY